MRNFEQQISQRVRAFVDEITDMARQQAMEALTAALQTGGRGVMTGRGRGGNGAAGRARLASARNGRRSIDEIDAACDALMSEITARPGQRVEQIAATLQARTKDLALPIRKLIKDKRVRTEGQRRATKYFPGAGGAAGGGKRRGRKRAAKSE